MASLSLPITSAKLTIVWEDECEQEATISTSTDNGQLSEASTIALATIEALVLEHFKAGVDILSDDYLLGLEIVIANLVAR